MTIKDKLMEKAIKKLKKLSIEELENFLTLNCCPHKKTHPCGMDTVCDSCGDWV